MIESSREVGWVSALVEHQQVLTFEDVFETSPTPDHTVVVMTRGEQELEAYGRGSWRRAAYGPGTVGMTPGGMTDRLRRRVNRDAGAACKINIYIPQIFFAEAADHLGRAGSEPLSALGHADTTVSYVAHALLRAMRGGAPDIYVESTVCWLAVHLMTFPNGLTTDSPAHFRTSGVRDKRISRVLDCISERFAEPLSIDQLAAEAGISKFHFTRLFQQAMGTTPYRWLITKRLDAAKRMLETTDVAVAEVARQCGFGSPNHFTTRFNDQFGLSPTDYRSGTRSDV